MRKYTLLCLFIAFPLFLLCQNISVKSFRLLNNDLDALVNHPEIDRSNGEKAALIKVVTTETGFDFGGGQLGIVKVVYKTAEIWVYVPAKLKAITIAHSKLGQLPNRFYNFDIPIESGKVYEMVLVTGTVETIVKPTEITTQWLAINSKPEGASVFIEEQFVGKTPLSLKYPEGDYTYRLELPKYNSQAGKVNLAGEKKVLDLTLKPRFGNIKITTTPETGMMIYLDDENTGKITPATLEGVASGDHTLNLMSQWYQPQAKKVTVTDEGTTNADFTMTPAFADITVITNPTSDIFIDDKKVGNGSYSARMLTGIYTVKADKEKHHYAQQQVSVVAGNKQTITLNLKPMVGLLDIISTPFDAVIMIDGKEYGTTPNTIKNLLVGDYSVTIKKVGYNTITKTVTITENATTEVNETLTNGVAVKNTSNPSHFNYNKAEGLTDADGNIYKTVKIGTQEWMAENLKTTKYRDGSSIPNITDNTSWTNQIVGAYCWYDNDSINTSTYGVLYNFYAVVDSRNLCPMGWHVPADKDWTILTTFLDGRTVAGGKLKATTLWNSPNTGANNSSGFTAFPGGYRNYGGNYNYIGSNGYWWSSTEDDAIYAWNRRLFSNSSEIGRNTNYNKRNGFSVRCIKD